MDDTNITIEEYISLKEEKARRRAIFFNDTLTSEAALLCEPTVSSLTDEIDFRISFDESDDEDCTYSGELVKDSKRRHYSGSLTDDILKIIFCRQDVYPSRRYGVSVPALTKDHKRKEDQYAVKMDDPNITMDEYIRLEEEKARRLGKCLTGNCYVCPLNDEIDFRISFDESDDEDCTVNYALLLPSPSLRSDFLTEPALSPQHIDEFDLKDETSLFECDEDEQNVLYFNDLFLFNVIYPDDSKSDEDNDDDKIDIEHSSGDLSVIPLPNVINNNDGAYAHASNKLLETINTAYSLNEYSVFDTGINTAYPGEWIWRIDFLYNFSQSSCDFTTVAINGESEERTITEEIIRNYYDREDGETTSRFKV
ncbi:hypothetical protein Tco_0696709 [Tanacetum coccineum]